jgi:peroxiredoxin
MTRIQELKLFAAIGVFASLVFVCAVSLGQTRAKPPKTIFIDAAGKQITNNEFVDLRLANPSEKDIATKTVLDDGTTEFRLAAVPQEGTVAPVFEAPVMGGKTVNTDQLKGKVLVLNFWFIGCAGCIIEMPKLNDLAVKYGSNADIEFIAIAPNTEQELRDFLVRERFDYKMVGQARSIINLFAFKGFPRNIVIGRDGKIAYWRTTVKAWDKFDAIIRAELVKN